MIMTKVLMVCLGNICRSPMAHGIFRDKALSAALSVSIDSAGTSGYHEGELPDSRAIENMKSHDIDITDLRSRQFTVTDFDEFDLIFAMDASNYSNILKLARNKADEQKVELFLNLASPGKNQSVPDPYYGGDSGFEHVYQLLDLAADKLVERLKK